MRRKLVCGVGLIGVLAMTTQPIRAQEASAVSEMRVDLVRVRDLQRSAKTVKEWVAQVEGQESQSLVQVTEVRLDRTEAGLDITLETVNSKPLQVDATKFRTEGNSLIADIPNAVLALPNAQGFTAENPTGDIATVRVSQTARSTIRVSVVGTTGLPKSEVTLRAAGLAYSLNPEAEEPEEEVVVTGEGQRGYRVPNTSTATKTDTPIRDVPASIQVIPQQVLKDQQVTRLTDAIRNVGGAAVFNPTYYPSTAVSIRGFLATAFSGNIFRNGLRDPAGQNPLPELSDVERVEVLKGPASVLFGQGNPGGIINFVTKQPLRDPFYAAEATIGSYDYYRGAIDLSGPLNDSKTILYRLNASYRDSGSFINFLNQNALLVAPVLSWQISTNTKLTLEGAYSKAEDPLTWGLPAVGSVLPNPNGKLRRNLNTNEPDSNQDYTIGRVGYRLEHKFSNNWLIRNAFQASFYSGEANYFLPSSLRPDNRTLNRTAFIGQKNDINFYDLTTDLVGKFSTGSIEHQVLFGFNLDFNQAGFVNNQATAAPLDIFNPVYNNTFGRLTRASDTLAKTTLFGIYVQDQIKLAENLKLLLGGRFDTYSQKLENFVTNSETNQSGNAFSPRAGIVYQPVPPISLYASYSRSFTPTGSAFGFGGSQFQPERGTQYEVGVKADISNWLSATLAFYDLTRSNVLTADPARQGFSIQVGEQRSKGIEFNLAGEILSGWNIIAGYGYTDTEITKDNTFAVGNQLQNIPRNSFNLWTTYEIQRGGLQGLGVGVGFFYVSDRKGDLANSFEVPSYFRTDAAIFYKRDRLRVQVNFKNLFNVDYFEGALNRLRVYPGEPFTVQGTISWQF